MYISKYLLRNLSKRDYEFLKLKLMNKKQQENQEKQLNMEKEKNIIEITEDAMNGIIDFEEALIRRVRMLKGHSADILELLKDFSNTELIDWLKTFDIETFVGSSKRVFPESFKASEILKKWTDKLKTYNSFHLYTDHILTNIEKDYLVFNNDINVTFDKVVYGLGGASWSKTGSDGKWASLFAKHEIEINPFMPSNCGFEIEWSDEFCKPV